MKDLSSWGPREGKGDTVLKERDQLTPSSEKQSLSEMKSLIEESERLDVVVGLAK